MMHARHAAVDEYVAVDLPKSDDGRRLIGVRGLLEWAFGVECARLEFDDVVGVGPSGFANRSSTANICDMLALGDEPGVGVKVDQFVGQSHPHPDADVVVGAVRNTLIWPDAVMVAQYARSAQLPVWDLGAPVVTPRRQSRGRYAGGKVKTEAGDPIRYKSKRGWVSCKPRYCPVDIYPTAQQISAARRGYLNWYSCLMSVRSAIPSDDLKKFVLTKAMPVRQPWKKNS